VSWSYAVGNYAPAGGASTSNMTSRQGRSVTWRSALPLLLLILSQPGCEARNNPPRFLVERGQSEIVLRLKESPETPVGKCPPLSRPRLSSDIIRDPLRFRPGIEPFVYCLTDVPLGGGRWGGEGRLGSVIFRENLTAIITPEPLLPRCPSSWQYDLIITHDVFSSSFLAPSDFSLRNFTSDASAPAFYKPF
jgi:hypothetical protein